MTAAAAPVTDYAIIKDVSFRTKRVKPGGNVKFTVLLDHVAASNVLFLVEMQQIMSDGTLGGTNIIKQPLGYSVPQGERSLFTVADTRQAATEGMYLLTVSQLNRTIKFSKVVEVNNGAPAVRRSILTPTVVFTPVTDITMENPTAPEDPEVFESPEPGDEGVNSLVTRGARKRSKMITIAAGSPFYLTVMTEDPVKQAAVAADQTVNIQITKTDTSTTFVTLTNPLRTNEQYHTYSLVAKDAQGVNLPTGSYRLSVFRPKLDGNAAPRYVSLLFEVI